MKSFFALLIACSLLFGWAARADGFSRNPEKSFFIGIDFGAGLDLDKEARSPVNMQGATPEAYSMGSFLFGVRGGYRFNERVGIEGGWHEQTHNAYDDWGRAYYQVGHLAMRLAWPLPTRQTPVLKIGPVLGLFAHGTASPWGIEDNTTHLLGGLTSLSLEYELALGIVAALEVAYLPVYRFGADGVFQLWINEDNDLYLEPDELYDTKDFTNGRVVHLLWISLNIQFEWTFR